MRVELTKKDIGVLKRAIILALVHRDANATLTFALHDVFEKLHKQFKNVPNFDEDRDTWKR